MPSYSYSKHVINLLAIFQIAIFHQPRGNRVFPVPIPTPFPNLCTSFKEVCNRNLLIAVTINCYNRFGFFKKPAETVDFSGNKK